MTKEKKHVFIIGSKGIPARYGGFETFVQELVRRRKSEDICYHVACSLDESRILSSKKVFYYEGVQCFVVPMWAIGAAKAVLYDLEALKYCIYYIEKAGIRDAVVYVLACRIGPFFAGYCRVLKKLGASVYLNPDGHEWLRAKWSPAVKKYWKYSEGKMVREADLVICDSTNIESYIRETYSRFRPKTCFLPYGADVPDLSSEKTASCLQLARKWLSLKGAEPGEYYLIVGRFVPENNYETMLREFIGSDTKRRLIVITNAEPSPFYSQLSEKTHFAEDARIIFPGTVYENDLLTGIRLLAWAYIHGHSVGGTNPSLLEAMGTTKLNLLYDVSFNREVGGGAALYWNREEGSLRSLIGRVDGMALKEREKYGEAARRNIGTRYSWEHIVERYEGLFLGGVS